MPSAGGRTWPGRQAITVTDGQSRDRDSRRTGLSFQRVAAYGPGHGLTAALHRSASHGSMLHFVLALNFCVIVNLVSAGSQDQIVRCGNIGGFRKLRGGFDDDEKVFLAGVPNPGHEL